MGDYGAFGATAAAIMRGGAALYPTTTATTVQVKGGKGGEVISSDGPFAETKEVLTGFHLLECPDLDKAVEWASQIPGAWTGKVEVRPVGRGCGAGGGAARTLDDVAGLEDHLPYVAARAELLAAVGGCPTRAPPTRSRSGFPPDDAYRRRLVARLTALS